ARTAVQIAPRIAAALTRAGRLGRTGDIAAWRFMAHQHFRHPRRPGAPRALYRLGPRLGRTGKLRPFDFPLALAASRAVLGLTELPCRGLGWRQVICKTQNVRILLKILMRLYMKLTNE